LQARRRFFRRGGLYGRPCRTGGTTGPVVIAIRLRRSAEVRRKAGAFSGGYKIRPYSPAADFFVGAAFMAARAAPAGPLGLRTSQPGRGVRQGYAGNRGRFRADIQSAPTWTCCRFPL